MLTQPNMTPSEMPAQEKYLAVLQAFCFGMQQHQQPETFLISETCQYENDTVPPPKSYISYI